MEACLVTMSNQYLAGWPLDLDLEKLILSLYPAEKMTWRSG